MLNCKGATFEGNPPFIGLSGLNGLHTIFKDFEILQFSSWMLQLIMKRLFEPRSIRISAFFPMSVERSSSICGSVCPSISRSRCLLWLRVLVSSKIPFHSWTV